MLVDGSKVPERTVFATDLCIVEGGTAAIAFAFKFANSCFRVSLLECHGFEQDTEIEDPYTSENMGQRLLRARSEVSIDSPVSIYFCSTLLNIETDGASPIIRLHVAGLEGNRFSIIAKYFILAGGSHLGRQVACH